MTSRIFLLVFALAFTSSSFAQTSPPPGAAAADKEAPGEAIDMSEPPFWMSSYEEFADLQQDQKDLYIEKLLPLLKDVPRLDPVSKKDLTDAADWYQSWNRIRKKVYEGCQDKKIEKLCEDLADIRLQALDMYSNQKVENRKASQEATKESKSSKQKKSK